LAGGMNLYGFAGGDPVNYSDPLGLTGCELGKDCWSAFVSGVKSWLKAPETGTAVMIGAMAFADGAIDPQGGAADAEMQEAVMASRLAGREISDDALVVRGGTNTAERVAAGAERIDAAGHVHGVSVNSAAGATVAELARGIPNKQIGVTTAGAIRAAGGSVVADATARNPTHCLVSCMTPESLSRLLTPTIPNPHQ
jgi:hypothetical protein